MTRAFETSLAAFRSAWVAVGLAGEFRRSGDFRTRDIGEVSVLVIRDDDHFNVCRNLCPHEDEPFTRRHEAGHIVKLVCPLHAWVFDRTGRFRPPLSLGDAGYEPSSGRERDLEVFDVRVAGGIIWSRMGSQPTVDEPSAPSTALGTPSLPQRVTVDCEWFEVADHLQQLPGSQVFEPNSAVCRTGGDRNEVVLVTVVPRGPGRCELMAWTDLESASNDRGIASFLHRRKVLDDLAARAVSG